MVLASSPGHSHVSACTIGVAWGRGYLEYDNPYGYYYDIRQTEQEGGTDAGCNESAYPRAIDQQADISIISLDS